jgi:hypothetical protein
MKKAVLVFGVTLVILTATLFCKNVPAGDFAAGMLYTQTVNSSPRSEITLATNAVVFRDGLGLPSGAGFVFETATNDAYRYDSDIAYISTEVVVAYNDSRPPTILIWDWSCSEESPCADGKAVPSYQWQKPVGDMGCYLKTMSPPWEKFTVLPYKNKTRKVFVGGEARWKNEVFFLSCKKPYRWTLVYSHLIERGAVIGIVPNALFGPIIETFLPHPVPMEWQIPPLGFFGSKLIVDGKSYPLDANISFYQNPTSASNFGTAYLNPNRSFLVQSFPNK